VVVEHPEAEHDEELALVGRLEEVVAEISSALGDLHRRAYLDGLALGEGPGREHATAARAHAHGKTSPAPDLLGHGRGG
jgi:hypothetical protein